MNRLSDLPARASEAVPLTAMTVSTAIAALTLLIAVSMI